MPAGIYISEVTSGGAAENAGLKSGYVLTSFDGHSITSTSELKSLLQYYSAGETVEVEVQVPDNGSYETKTFSLTSERASALQMISRAIPSRMRFIPLCRGRKYPDLRYSFDLTARSPVKEIHK